MAQILTAGFFESRSFFDFHGTDDLIRLRIVAFHLKGRTSAWYQWMKVNSLLTNWADFLHNLRLRFGASAYDDPQGQLSKLSQRGSVAQFQSDFEAMMNQVTGISESLLISFFISGLRSPIQWELLLSRPPSLIEAFALARAYEAQLDDSSRDTRPWSKWTPKSTQSTSLGPISSSPNPTPPPKPQSTTSLALPNQTVPPISPPMTKPSALPPLLPTPTLPVHRFSAAELRDKREKGICYNCDQKWSSGHKCRSKFLLLLGTADDDDEAPPDSPTPTEFTTDDTVISGDISSLNALAGQGNPRSLRLLGYVGFQAFQVLIDSGSTHNFVKPLLAERLGLPVQLISAFKVYIGNGDVLPCSQLCPRVPLDLQGV